MPRTPIATPHAPQAIGTYSQAIRAGSTVYLSGQIPLDPATGELVTGDIEAQVRHDPAQYLWLHRRFKTRPAGEARPY